MTDFLNQAFYELAAEFPTKADTKRTERTRDRLLAAGFEVTDIIEGVERVIWTHKGNYPSLLIVSDACKAARADRKIAQRSREEYRLDGEGKLIRDMNPSERAHALAEFRRIRDLLVSRFDMDMPSKTRWIHVDSAPEGWQSNRVFLYVGKLRDGRWSNPFVGNDAADCYERWFPESGLADLLGELVGKTLLCGCRPPRCHAPFLVKRANDLRDLPF